MCCFRQILAMIADGSPRRALWPWVLGLVGVTALVYFPVVGFEATNYDDPEYVFTNPNVRAGLSWPGVRWAFTTAHAANWHPLTWLSHQADVTLFDTNAGGHHFTNLVLHVANVALLFALLHRLTGAVGRSALVAAWFGLHPLHVESVAWIAERKDVLSACFGLLTLLAYERYARAANPPDAPVAPEANRTGQGAGRWLVAALVCFALGLMSKPMLVTLPVVMLLLDVWPLSRLPRDAGHRTWKAFLPLFREKLPFFALAGLSSLVTLVAQRQGGAVRPLESWPLVDRVANALTATVLYLVKTVWPVGLSPFYPLPEHIPWWQAAGAAVALGGVSLWVWRTVGRAPWRAVGWAWFLVMLVPVIGIVQVGMQQMADRYTYLPLLGIFLWAAWEAKAVADRVPPARSVLVTAAVGLVLACAVVTRKQVMHWRDGGALFTHALAVNPKNYLAHNNLGYHLYTRGRVTEAIAHYEAALRLLPTYAYAHSNLGRALAEQGRFTEAAEHFVAVLREAPGDVMTRNNLGNVLAMAGRHEEAIEQFRQILKQNPNHAAAHSNWALSAEALDQPAVAIAHYRQALALAPNLHAALNNLAWLLATLPDDSLRNGAEALQLAERACRATDCTQPVPLFTLAAASAETGRFDAAIALATQALTAARAANHQPAIQRAEEMLAAFRSGRPFRCAPGR
jgi:tetratricopeptide (TPR) repeat protein